MDRWVKGEIDQWMEEGSSGLVDSWKDRSTDGGRMDRRKWMCGDWVGKGTNEWVKTWREG